MAGRFIFGYYQAKPTASSPETLPWALLDRTNERRLRGQAIKRVTRLREAEAPAPLAQQKREIASLKFRVGPRPPIKLISNFPMMPYL
ncbi:uncharacterized protein TrAFT101_007429 [Trichoderma asperellum]|uniref:uncharacterized protein n=1 Tax=Trichoderma asperellum TaxID=101201 RepID=UPI00332033CD|nr:hypothetical protein TrAFT101_007429 [Trichoderma asperellum]